MCKAGSSRLSNRILTRETRRRWSGGAALTDWRPPCLYTLHSKVNVDTNITAHMKIIRAESLGMCFGVRDAIALALEQAEAAPLTILGDLVHNASRAGALQARGIAIAHDAAQVKTHTVMVTAHGASERTLANTRALGLEVVEATCPLVHVAHRAVAALVRDGYHPVIIGQRAHVEVRGLTEDLDAFDVVLDEHDVLALDEHPRIGIAAQTTQPIERVRHLVALIRRRFPQSDVRFIDTVCQPTKQRQSAALELARQCDVVIVIGGANSNNTRELVNTCSRSLFARAPRPDGVGSSSGMVPRRSVGGHHGWHVDARRRHRSRRPAHPGARRRASALRAHRGSRPMKRPRRSDAGCSSSCLPLAWRGSKRPASTTFA